MSETVTETKEISCPGCKQKIDVEIQRQKPKVVIEERETITQTEHNHDHSHEEPKETKFTHTDLAKLMSPGENFRTCPDGNCGTKIKNAKVTTKFKKCTKCNSNTVPKNSEYCPTCGKEPEEWDESEVELKTKEEEEEDGD